MFGILADATTTAISIGIGIGISVLAAITNSPLMWNPLMGKPKPTSPIAQRKLPDEDDVIFQKILNGDSDVNPELAFQINQDRGLHGKPSVVPRVKPYQDEKEHLDEIKTSAGDMIKFRRNLYDRTLAGLASDEHDPERFIFNRDDLVHMLNTLKGDNQELNAKASGDLGQWMGEYMADNGYSPHTTSIMMKQMFMLAFPPLQKDDDVTEDNVEELLLNTKKLLDRYSEMDNKNSTTRTLAHMGHSTGWW